ncbi:MAG: hypothetical protein Q9224_004902, partial [Gallowayella concinna]
MQHQTPNSWLSLLRDERVKPLLNLARTKLENHTVANYKGERFISMEHVQRALDPKEIDTVFTEYKKHSHSDQLPLKVLKWRESRMLFAVTLLADLEAYYVPLLIEGLTDDLLFDDDKFETLCRSANVPIECLKSSRNRFGAVLCPGRIRCFSKGVISPFLTRTKLDNGSYGQIYKVEVAPGHLRGSEARVVAEKEIRPSDDGKGSQEEWDRLCREAITLQKRPHPNIIPLLASYFREIEESERDKKTLHLIFPLADQNLAEWIACAPKQNDEEEERMRIDLYRRIYALVSGLSYLHRESLEEFTSHHDIKPSNILVFDFEFKLADFGTSHLRSSILGSETARQNLGTYDYHPPEYWCDNGLKAPSPHGRPLDAWAMGCVILELAIVITYGRRSSMVSKFKDERLHNPNKRRPMLLHERGTRADSSYHNNMMVVNDWLKRIKHDGSGRVKDLLRVAENLMAEDPSSRLYLWEAELDLYTIFDVDADLPKRLERHALGVESPHRRILNGSSTPLHRAAQASNSERAQDLLEHGWPLFIQDRDGNTAADLIDRNYHLMASSFVERYDLYLGRSKTFQAKNDQERSAFRLIHQGDKVKLEALLEEGIDCGAVDENDHTLIYYALGHSRPLMLELLLKFVDTSQLRRRDAKTRMTPLQAAATKDHYSHVSLIIDYLLRQRSCKGDHTYTSDIEDRTLEGKTALFLAIERGYMDTTRVLLDHEAQIFTQCKQRNTPVHAMASTEDTVLHTTLLARILGADGALRCFEHKNQHGQTPIVLALLHQNLECFRQLREKGASIQTVNNEGENLLHIMARKSHYEFLLQYVDEFDQAAFEAKDLHGATPSMIAEKCQNMRLLGLLESRRLKHFPGHEMQLSIPAANDQPNFYTLQAGGPWLSRHKHSEYWAHLTSHSFEVYEAIYHRCKRGRAGIRFTDFATQFFNSWPSESVLRQAWKRLLPTPYDEKDTSTLSKPFVLAILYMLHLEQFFETQNIISKKQLNFLT